MNKLLLPAALLLLVGLLPGAQSPARLTAGQEFVYTGSMTMSARDQKETVPIRIDAVVTDANGATGYTISTLQTNPGATGGFANFLPATVATHAFKPDGTEVPQPANDTSNLAAQRVLQSLLGSITVPLAPPDAGKAGGSWSDTDMLPIVRLAVPVHFTVQGQAVVDGHNCLKSVGKPATLPAKVPLGSITVTVTDFSDTLCVDPATGVVNERHLTASATAQNEPAQFDTDLKLQSSSRLSPADLTQRRKELKALATIADSLVGPQASAAGPAQAVKTASAALTSFRATYPNSPYMPAADQDAKLLSTMQQMAAQQSQASQGVTALVGKPAPAFKLTSLAGPERSVNDYRGRVLLINFFASW